MGDRFPLVIEVFEEPVNAIESRIVGRSCRDRRAFSVYVRVGEHNNGFEVDRRKLGKLTLVYASEKLGLEVVDLMRIGLEKGAILEPRIGTDLDTPAPMLQFDYVDSKLREHDEVNLKISI